MTKLVLDTEEHEVLVRAIEREMSDLRDEISHTDSNDFKEMLKHRQMVMGGILNKVRDQAAETVGPAETEPGELRRRP